MGVVMNKILIVDDNAALRLVLSEFLTLNYPSAIILQAEDGVEGLTLAETERPDLILLDARMPYMNGSQVAQKLRQQSITKHIPIVAISAEREDYLIVTRLREIANAILLKPFSAEEMFAVIDKVVQAEFALL